MITYAMMEQWSDLVGIGGVILTLVAYYLLSINRLLSTSFIYVWFNLLGSMMLMFSLLFHWNLASALIEIAWITISAIGLYRAIKLRRERLEKVTQ